MGFHKRYIDMPVMLRIFSSDGVPGVERWLRGADALIVNAIDHSNSVVEKLKIGDEYGAQLILEYELYRQGLS